MRSEIQTALIGVGATIAGTILGWILNALSNSGSLKVFVSFWEDSFKHLSSFGEMVPCVNRAEVQNFSYKVSLDLYNSSGNIKIMRNIRIVFSDGKHDIKIETPLDDATKRSSPPLVFYDKVGPINIPPKTVINIMFHGGASNQNGELDFIWKSKKVYLLYTDEKNRLRREVLKVEDYENYFTTHKLEEQENG